MVIPYDILRCSVAVYGTSLPGVLEIVSCHNNMCEKEEHELLILKITFNTRVELENVCFEK